MSTAVAAPATLMSSCDIVRERQAIHTHSPARKIALFNQSLL